MNRILPQFQKFMTDRKLAHENQIPFYAGWASKFIRFSNVRQSTPTELKIQLFLDELKIATAALMCPHCWQVRVCPEREYFTTM